MTREEFIQECAMRNMAQCFGKWSPRDCNDDSTYLDCYQAAVKLANKIFV